MSKRLSKWDRWFRDLKQGDRVIMIIPWSDRQVIATVGKRVPNPNLQKFLYRNKFGTRLDVCLSSWYGDSYHHVIPLGHELRYSGKRGFLIHKLPETITIGDSEYTITPAYKRGAQSYRNGVHYLDNPYRDGCQSHYDWNDGHVNESEKID